MLRDDILKRTLRERRPEPTAAFSGRVRSTLTKLPQGKRRPAWRFMPASAIVFLGVAALCVVIINNKTIGSLFVHGMPPATQQLAVGGQPTATDMETAARETPEPTPADSPSSNPSAQETPNPSPPDGQTTAPAAQDTPMPTPDNPQTTAMPPQETPEPTPSEAQKTSMPDPGAPISTTRPDITKRMDEYIAEFLNGGIDLREMIVTHPMSSGSIAYGDKAYVDAVYKGPDAIVYEVIVSDDKTGSMQKYFENHAGKDGNPENRVLLRQEQNPGLLLFVLCPGLVDKDYIGSIVSEEKFNLVVSANDDIPSKLYIWGIYAVLEPSETGKFRIYVINTSPGYRQTGGFTILSRLYSDTAEGGRKLEGTYALPID